MNFDVVPVLTKHEVEESLLAELQRQVGRRPESANCDGNFEGRPGGAVGCTVVADGAATPFVLTVTTVEGGKINYRYEPRD